MYWTEPRRLRSKLKVKKNVLAGLRPLPAYNALLAGHDKFHEIKSRIKQVTPHDVKAQVD